MVIKLTLLQPRHQSIIIIIRHSGINPILPTVKRLTLKWIKTKGKISTAVWTMNYELKLWLAPSNIPAPIGLHQSIISFKWKFLQKQLMSRRRRATKGSEWTIKKQENFSLCQQKHAQTFFRFCFVFLASCNCWPEMGSWGWQSCVLLSTAVLSTDICICWPLIFPALCYLLGQITSTTITHTNTSLFDAKIMLMSSERTTTACFVDYHDRRWCWGRPCLARRGSLLHPAPLSPWRPSWTWTSFVESCFPAADVHYC